MEQTFDPDVPRDGSPRVFGDSFTVLDRCYSLEVSLKQLSDAPAWNPDEQDSPPFSAAAALRRAADFIVGVPVPQKCYWQLEAVALKHAEYYDYWIWSVRYGLRRQGFMSGVWPSFECWVLMDGSVVQLEVSECDQNAYDDAVEILSKAALPKLRRGDKVAIVSPSFAAPARWPQVYELGLKRLREDFGLVPVAYPATAKLNAPPQERTADLIAAFENPEIKAVISTLGGDDQVTYVGSLPKEPFRNNPKPYFGYSDNTHIANHLWLCGVPSYYGGALFTEFAQTPRMDSLTERYLRQALFEGGEAELSAARSFNDINVDWDSPDALTTEKLYEPSEGWQWDAPNRGTAEGITWGGCLESLDELLRHRVRIPLTQHFDEIVLLVETSEEMPSHEYTHRILRAFGERGALELVRGVLVGRPKAWNFANERTPDEKARFRREQREAILSTVRAYNPTVPVVQNIDFGHTSPQIPIPYGRLARIDADAQTITCAF